jgi:hypothetical protein
MKQAAHLVYIACMQFVRRSSFYTESLITSGQKIVLDLALPLMYIELFI